MEVSVKEAAVLLRRSPRAVRLMAQHGRIPARLVGGRWLVEAEELVARSEQLAAEQRAKVEQVREQVNRALDKALPKELTDHSSPAGNCLPNSANPADVGRDGRAFYSVKGLQACDTALGLLKDTRGLAELSGSRGAELTAAKGDLVALLRNLVEGCHQFHPQVKIERFVAARSAACGALAELLAFAAVHENKDASDLAARLERDMLGLIRGLLRRAEKSAR